MLRVNRGAVVSDYEGVRSASRAVGIGAWLGAERRMRGVGIDGLAHRTRIPRRSLERLEAGAFDENPDGFARGFVRAVAQALDLDPEEVVSRLAGDPTGRAQRRASGHRLRRPLLIGGLLALALSLGIVGGLRVSNFPDAPAAATVLRHDPVATLWQAVSEADSGKRAAAPTRR